MIKILYEIMLKIISFYLNHFHLHIASDLFLSPIASTKHSTCEVLTTIFVGIHIHTYAHI